MGLSFGDLGTPKELAATQTWPMISSKFKFLENPCLPVCEQDFTKIETPLYEDPRPVFNSLAYGQFTQEEFRNGYAMEILDGR